MTTLTTPSHKLPLPLPLTPAGSHSERRMHVMTATSVKFTSTLTGAPAPQVEHRQSIPIVSRPPSPPCQSRAQERQSLM